MMSNSEARKREAERAAGELVADVDTLAGFLRGRIDVDPRALAEALVAAGFGRVDAARREVAEAERRWAERGWDEACEHDYAICREPNGCSDNPYRRATS